MWVCLLSLVVWDAENSANSKVSTKVIVRTYMKLIPGLRSNTMTIALSWQRPLLID